jgi:cytochrome c peroxidase
MKRIMVCLVLMVSLPIKAELPLRELYAKPVMQWPVIETSDKHAVPELAPLPKLSNPPTKAMKVLGDRLFHDPTLSKDNSVSCASCHESRLVFTDQRKVSVGIDLQAGRRNTPAIFGIDLWQSFFLDGRAKTAEQQALMPIVDPKEMNATIAGVLKRLNKDEQYVTEFTSAFGNDADITADTLSKAIVAFERTISPPRSQFMKFIELAYQTPTEAVNMLNQQQLEGLHLFRTKAKCMTCHNGSLLSDNKFHVTGFHFYQRKNHDVGRFDVTGDPKDSGAFRTPSLWAVSKTGPWFHNGILSNLRGVIRQYNAGGPRPKPKKHQLNDPNFPKTTDLLVKLHLTPEEQAALEAFLKIL